jgi:hypothetical protein
MAIDFLRIVPTVPQGTENPELAIALTLSIAFAVH